MDAGSAGSNPAGAPFPDDVCIHHLFEKQALKHSISSSHRDMLQEPQVKVLAEQIKECIDRISI